MGFFQQIRMNLRPRVEGARPDGGFFGPGKSLALLVSLCAGAASAYGQAAPTYQITTASPATVPAGAAGASIGLTGTLPDFTQGTYQVCFYTGSGSATPLTPTATAGVQTINVPATTIQSIDPANFTVMNSYVFQARVYVVPSAQTCDGSFDATLTNSLIVPIIEPTLAAYSGPTFIPQPNTAAGLQAAPTSITLSGANFVADTTVLFGSYGQVTPRTLTPNALTFALPSAFLTSAASTKVTISVCNGGALAKAFCSTPASPITFTLSGLANSSGTITATPSPALTSQPVTLTSTFKQSSYSTNPVGSPSGTVTFKADGQTLEPARLILDTTAGFTPLTTALTVPTVATPVIAPAAGSYTNSATVTLTDTTAGASIYYTQDGSTPTTDSTLYAAPFSITTSQTLMAIGALAGSFNSTVASAAYTINISPPTQVVFQTQPVTTPINTAITPAVQVAAEDVNGNVVASYTGPVTLSLVENATQGALGGTLTQNAVAGIATFADLTVNNVGSGYIIHAVSGRLTPALSSAFPITPYPITLTVQSKLIGIASTLTGSFALGHAAPTGGVTVTLASSAPTNVSIAPATITVAAGQTTGSFTYTGVAAGDANLTATAANYQTGTTTVTGTAAQVSLGTIPAVAPEQMVSLALSLPANAPPGGTTVTFTSSNTNVATVTSSVFIPEGQRTAAINPQITGVVIGTTTITASAPGFAPDRRAVSVTVVASFNPTTTQLNLVTSTNTTLNLTAPAQTGGITFTLTSDDPTVATVPATVTVVQGSTKVAVPITGVKTGSTTIRADSPGVTEATGTVNVVSTIVVNQNPLITGVKLERGMNVYLPVSPSSPTTVTITIADPSVATVSTSQSTVGTQTVTFTNITSTYVGAVYAQGQTTGSTTISISAPGFTTGTAPLNVYPSGFSYYVYGAPTFPTTTFSSASSLTLYTTLINPTTGNYYDQQYPLNPGIADISVPITSSDITVGTIVTSPAVFHAGDSYNNSVSFKPAGNAGNSIIKIGTPPAPFSVPAYQQAITANVTAPQIGSQTVTTGVNLTNSAYIQLPVAAPTAEMITVTSSDSSTVKISASATVVGTGTVTFPGVTNQGNYLYLQGQKTGTATLTVSAPGYSNGTITVNVYPTGFGINYYQGNINTQTNSGTSTFSVYADILNPSGLTVNYEGLTISPGVAPISVQVTSSSTRTGTVTSPLVFNPGDSNKSSTFTPLAAGTSTLSISVPSGYSIPANDQSITATVTAPTLAAGFNSSSVRTGNHLYTYNYVSLTTAPTSPATVTVTSSDPTKVTLSLDQNTVGTPSVTFTNVTSTGVGYVYVQGQSVGSVTLTASLSGYSSGTSTATVNPSGFGYYLYSFNGGFSTTTFSQPTGISYYTYSLDPTDFHILDVGQALNPGTPSVPLNVTSSATSVGTITTSPVTFVAGSGSATITSFQPVSAGMSNVTINTPAGYSKPNAYQTLAVTVTAPTISVSNVETGKFLQSSMGISLPQTPPNAVTVTVRSNGPAIATISKDGTVVGGTTLTFPNVTTTSVGTIFVQGQALGGTTLTVSAPGYNNGEATITVDPSGFDFYYYQGSFSTTDTSNPTFLTVYPTSLTPGTLTIVNANLSLNPGIGTINVPVTSSDTSVGTIVTSPLPFVAGTSSLQTSFQPVAAGMSTLTVVPPAQFSTPSQGQTSTATVTHMKP